MKKSLIVFANPKEESFTESIARFYAEGVKESGGEVDVVDLYQKEVRQDFCIFNESEEDKRKREMMQVKILWADEIVFVHPLWWFNMPGIMKNFLDINFASKFAYFYKNGRPHGLLQPRRAKVFITCDGPLWFYLLIGIPFLTQWVIGTLWFCGLKVNAFKIFPRTRFKSDEKRKKFLEKAKEIGKKK